MKEALNLANLFLERAAAQPTALALASQREGGTATYAELGLEIESLACLLRQKGIKPGMNVGLHHASGRTYIALTYAVWLCGACITPLPLELADEEKLHLLNHIAIDWILADKSSPVFAQLTLESHPLAGNGLLLKIKKNQAAPAPLANLNPAFIRFTSGTTGDAKGVILSHETIFERIQAANACLAIGPSDRVVWLLSMAYHFAVSIVAYLTYGATIILSKNSFGVSTLEAANLYGATVIYAAPTHYDLMCQVGEGQLPSGLRLAIVTTACLSPDLARRFWERFGVALQETYGIIEIGLPAINVDHPRQKQGSVGRVLPAYELKLAAPDSEGIGEILLRGPGLLDAYYEPWLFRAQILEQRGGWLGTGDLGRLDGDGYLTIVGRSKELINVGGMKFFPQEVETVLERHPAIQEACVFAVKSSRFGEEPICHLVLAPGQECPSDEELRSHCSSRLATFKIPSQFVWMEQLARTASGKMIRKADKLRLP